MLNLLSQAVTVLAGRIVSRLAQFIAFIFLARALSPADFGWYGILTTTIVLCGILGNLGLRQSLAYEVGQSRITINQALSTAIIVWPIMSVFTTGAAFILLNRGAPMTSRSLVAVLFLGVSATILINLLQGINLGRGEIRRFTASENLPRVIMVVGISTLAVVGSLTVFSSVWAQVLGYVLTLPVALHFGFDASFKFSFDRRSLAGLVKYGMSFALNLSMLLVSTRVAMYVIERFSDDREVGYFFAATRVNEIFLEAATAFGMVLFSSTARQSAPLHGVQRAGRLSCWMLYGFLIIAVILAAVSPWLLPLIAGEQYRPAVSVMQILTLSLAPVAASKTIYPVLAGSGRPYFGTPVILFGLLINVALSLMLVPIYGALGGAVALVVGQWFVLFGYILICRNWFKVPVRSFLLPSRSDAKRLVFATRNAFLRKRK